MLSAWEGVLPPLAVSTMLLLSILLAATIRHLRLKPQSQGSPPEVGKMPAPPLPSDPGNRDDGSLPKTDPRCSNFERGASIAASKRHRR
jgi:hypothetical protein